MNDITLTSMYFILQETLGAWFFPTIILAGVLLVLLVYGFRIMSRSNKSVLRPLWIGGLAGVATAVVASVAVPYLTYATPSAFSSGLDVLLAFVLGLLPGVVVGVVVFTLAAQRYAARPAVR